MVSQHREQIDPDKVKAVVQFPQPQNQTKVRPFLGLASYYRRYIQNFAALARPLHKASETSSAYQWPSEDQETFDILRMKLTTTPNFSF